MSVRSPGSGGVVDDALSVTADPPSEVRQRDVVEPSPTGASAGDTGVELLGDGDDVIHGLGGEVRLASERGVLVHDSLLGHAKGPRDCGGLIG